MGSWADFFRFPKCVLLAPVRGGRRITRSQSLADLVNTRLSSWSEKKDILWQAVLGKASIQSYGVWRSFFFISKMGKNGFNTALFLGGPPQD